jgi:hypothetical protein
MRQFILLLLLIASNTAFSQKMLILDRANRAKTTKMYIGASLNYRMKGAENYWYQAVITDILPETKTLLLDNFPVKVDSIAEIKVRRHPVVRLLGGTLFTFGASLAFATTIAAIKGDDYRYGLLYGVSGGSALTGLAMSTNRTLKLGKKHRLRIIEIKFER